MRQCGQAPRRTYLPRAQSLPEAHPMMTAGRRMEREQDKRRRRACGAGAGFWGRSQSVVGRALLALPGGILLHSHRQGSPARAANMNRTNGCACLCARAHACAFACVSAPTFQSRMESFRLEASWLARLGRACGSDATRTLRVRSTMAARVLVSRSYQCESDGWSGSSSRPLCN